MLRNLKTLPCVLFLIFSLSIITYGQGTTGDIEGTVTDQTGALIPGAIVRVESTGTTVGFSKTVATNRAGYFILARIAPGTYRVTVTGENFRTFSQNVFVVVDKTETVNASLEPAVIEIEVPVSTDSAVTIDPRNTQIDTNITKEVIEALPKGTNFTTLLKIAPNVRPERLGGGFQIDGASGSENVFIIDGQEVTNFRTGELNTNNNLPFELLQEIQIKSTGFEAEYGGAIGGIVNAVTAGGNNDWHGKIGIAFRPSALQGRPNLGLDSFRFSVSTIGAEQNRFFRPNKDGGTHFFPVATLSGPIFKDRVWGLVSYAPQILETRRFIDYYSTPDPAVRTITFSEQYDATRVNQYAFGRIDAQPVSNLRVFGTFLWNPTVDDGEIPPIETGLFSSTPPISKAQYAIRGGRRNANSFNTQATWMPLDRMIVNFRAGRSFLNEKLFSYGRTADTRFAVSISSPVNPCNPNDINLPAGITPYCRGFNTGSNTLTFFDVSTRTTMDADVSFVGINAFGRHNIKAGWQLNRLYNDVDSGYVSSGYVLLYYGVNLTAWTGLPSLPFCDFRNIDPKATDCTLGTARIARFADFGRASSDNHAIFAQDSWTINNRFTVNYGLRTESEVVPSFLDPATTTDINFGWGSKIAPRLGVAFDLSGDGRSKIFGSYGWFYDRFKYQLPRFLFGGLVFMDAFAQIIPARGLTPFDYTLEAMLGGRGVNRGGECPITSGQTGYAECEFDRVFPSNSIGANPFAGQGAVDPNLETMRQSEWTIGYERELGGSLLLAARYTHKQLDQAIEDMAVLDHQGSAAFIIGNPGQGLACEIARSGNLPCTEEERVYDAVEIRIDKRAKDHFFNASYTWSRLFGNYSGLADSDRLGRNIPNITSAFDLPMLGWTAAGEPDNGLLATDRPHVFKAYGGYSFDWKSKTQRTTVSVYTTLQSGTPLTTMYNLEGLGGAILFGRGNLGRTEMFSETDLAVSHRYAFGRDKRFVFEPYIEIRNIFDERNEIARQTRIDAGDIRAPHLAAVGCMTCTNLLGVFDTLFNRGGIEQFVLAHLSDPVNRRLDYNQPLIFQAPREVRFGFRLRF